ncbi:hypothetical protein [Endothiovibrio diazotrophicus]
MRRVLFALLLLPPLVVADDFPPFFVVGDYRLIGQRPDSSETYAGRVEIAERKGGGLTGRRSVGGESVVMEVALERALAGEAQVLRMRFTEEGVAYEATCLLQSDLDNYARISCYRYRRDGATRRPGLEALFIETDGDFETARERGLLMDRMEKLKY